MVLPNSLIEDGAYSMKMIEPFNKKQLQPASYDLMLGDAEKDVIEPGEFMLASTVERVRIPHCLVGIIQGKSSVARKGLQVECAGVCNPGFIGQIVLELKNISDKPIDLRQFKNGICQILFLILTEDTTQPYSGQYQGQTGITE